MCATITIQLECTPAIIVCKYIYSTYSYGVNVAIRHLVLTVDKCEVSFHCTQAQVTIEQVTIECTLPLLSLVLEHSAKQIIDL